MLFEPLHAAVSAGGHVVGVGTKLDDAIAFDVGFEATERLADPAEGGLGSHRNETLAAIRRVNSPPLRAQRMKGANTSPRTKSTPTPSAMLFAVPIPRRRLSTVTSTIVINSASGTVTRMAARIASKPPAA